MSKQPDIQVIGEGPNLSEMSSTTLIVRVDGKDYWHESWSARNGSGDEWYDPTTRERVEDPTKQQADEGDDVEAADELAAQEEAFWAGYNDTWVKFAGPALIEASLAAGAKAVADRAAALAGKQ